MYKKTRNTAGSSLRSIGPVCACKKRREIKLLTCSTSPTYDPSRDPSPQKFVSFVPHFKHCKNRGKIELKSMEIKDDNKFSKAKMRIQIAICSATTLEKKYDGCIGCMFLLLN